MLKTLLVEEDPSTRDWRGKGEEKKQKEQKNTSRMNKWANRSLTTAAAAAGPLNHNNFKIEISNNSSRRREQQTQSS